MANDQDIVHQILNAGSVRETDIGLYQHPTQRYGCWHCELIIVSSLASAIGEVIRHKQVGLVAAVISVQVCLTLTAYSTHTATRAVALPLCTDVTAVMTLHPPT